MRLARKWLLTAIAGGFAAGAAQAVETKWSGFAQVTVGRVMSGSPTKDLAPSDPDYYWAGTPTPYPLWGKGNTGKDDFKCPCFTANYEYTGLYEYKEWQASPETLAGIQGDFQFTPEWSATVQAVARGADGKAAIDWAFASWKITPQLTLQFGHKRLPLYYYSDFMYVGYAYPWIRPPMDLYAWQIYSYKGANLLYRTNFGEWSVNSNVWLGNEHDDDNDLLGNLYYGTRIDERWKQMAGVSVEAGNDIVSVRGIYMKNKVAREKLVDGTWQLVQWNPDGAGGRVFVNNVPQDFYGLAINVDYEGWIWRSEINYIDRPKVKDTYIAQAFGLGKQFGNHTVMFTWSDFTEKAPGREGWSFAELHTTRSLSYRWDFAPSQAFKLQFDDITDNSRWLYTGNARLLAASWNIVF